MPLWTAFLWYFSDLNVFDLKSQDSQSYSVVSWRLSMCSLNWWLDVVLYSHWSQCIMAPSWILRCFWISDPCLVVYSQDSHTKVVYLFSWTFLMWFFKLDFDKNLTSHCGQLNFSALCSFLSWISNFSTENVLKSQLLHSLDCPVCLSRICRVSLFLDQCDQSQKGQVDIFSSRFPANLSCSNPRVLLKNLALVEACLM